MTPLIFPLPGNETLARTMAENLKADLGRLEFRRFPDGESYLRYHDDLEGREVILVCSLNQPDDKTNALIFAAGTARELGAATVGLVAPYLAYMRQDKRFQPGEAVTSKHFATTINTWFDWLVTVDPHLHRRSDLSEIYTIPSAALKAAPTIAAWIRDNVDKPVLIGPDSESEQWVGAVAHMAGAPYLVLEKTRHGDRDVDVTVPQVEEWRDHTPVLVDDIISTARTMIETVSHLKHARMPVPVCIGIHAVFAGDAYQELEIAGAGRIVTCNTISHASNRIDLTHLMADGIRSCL